MSSGKTGLRISIMARFNVVGCSVYTFYSVKLEKIVMTRGVPGAIYLRKRLREFRPKELSFAASFCRVEWSRSNYNDCGPTPRCQLHRLHFSLLYQ